jgi:hypothetical protein
MNGFQTITEMGLFGNKVSISFTDWDGKLFCTEIHGLTAEEAHKRFTIRKTLEKVRKLVAERENAWKYARRYEFKINYSKSEALESLNRRLIYMSTYDERYYNAFVIEMTERIIPELESIEPNKESRFYTNYKRVISLFKDFFKREVNALEF